MPTEISIVKSGNIAINTTPITGGVVGRILFEGTGNVVQEDTNISWNNTTKSFVLRALNELSTTIPFSVRNSADTLNTFQTTGDGKTKMQGSIYYAEFDPASGLYIGNNFGNQWSLTGVLNETSWMSNGANSKFALGKTTASYRLDVNTATATPNEAVRVNNPNGSTDGKVGLVFTNTWTGDQFGNIGGVIYMNHQLVGPGNAVQHCRFDFSLNSLGAVPVVSASITAKSNILIGTPTEVLTDSHTVYFQNGTAPTTSFLDGIKMYSADQVAGNACLHTRSELGHVVKLFRGAAVASPSGGVVIDIEARAQLAALLAIFRVTGGNGQIAD